jgi:hypothetical protein
MVRWRSLHLRRVNALIPVIGNEAAALAVSSDELQGLTFLIGFLGFLPFLVWAELGGPGIARIIAAICGLFALGAFIFGVFLGRRSASLASRHVSERQGRLVRLSPHGWRVSRWRDAIDRAVDT